MRVTGRIKTQAKRTQPVALILFPCLFSIGFVQCSYPQTIEDPKLAHQNGTFRLSVPLPSGGSFLYSHLNKSYSVYSFLPLLSMDFILQIARQEPRKKPVKQGI